MLVLLVVLSIIFPAGLVHRVHAATTGLVCFAAITDVKCPAVPPSFNGPLTTPSTLLRLPIVINNTDTFAGFDITLKVGDVTMLKPYDADLTGTVVPSIVVLVKCIGGIKVQGSSCAPTDTSDTIHLAIIDTGIPLPVGTTGLLFTAVLNVIGTTPPGGITVGYQTGCPNSSVSGTTICVAMPNGTTSLTPETVQTGAFDNSNISTLPYVTMASAKNNLGQFLQGLTASTTDAITLASANSFNTTITPPTVNLSTIVKGKFATPVAGLSNPNVDFSTVTSGQVTSTLTATVSTFTAGGNDTVTVTATYLTQDQITFTSSSLEIIIVLPITVIDFGINTNPGAVSLTQPNIIAQTSISIAPSNFAGQVTLGVVSTSLPTGATASFNPPVITSPTISTLMVTILPSTPSGTYPVTLTASSTLNSVTKIHVAVFTVNLGGADFSISTNPSTIVFPSSVNSTNLQSSTIALKSSNFSGVVQLRAIVAPVSLAVSLTSPALFLNTNGQNQTTLTPSVTTSTLPGTYLVTVLATSGLISHTANVTVTILPPPPGNFAIIANPSSLPLSSGPSNSGRTTIKATSLNGFSGDILLSASSIVGNPGSIGLAFNPSQLFLPAGSTASSILTITATNVPQGTYFVNVIGTHVFSNGTIDFGMSNSTIVTVQVLASPPDFQLNIEIVPGANTIIAGESSTLLVGASSTGPNFFNGTISLAGQVIPSIANGPTLSFNPPQIVMTFLSQFSDLTISTTTLTPPGNYTIIVKGTSGALVHTTQFEITVVPPPTITLSPSTGPIGTQVTVHGSNFFNPGGPPFFSPIQLQVTFDDQLVGILFLQGTKFNFTFNVPISQTGDHQVHAKELFPFNLDVKAQFNVLLRPDTLSIDVSSGSIYFPGDTVMLVVDTSINGQATSVDTLQVLLVRPNSSNVTLTTVQTTLGNYEAKYPIPTSGALGTYAILITARQTGMKDGSGITTFEVKPTWLQAHGQTIMTAAGVVGAVGALGIVAFARRKWYLTRQNRS